MLLNLGLTIFDGAGLGGGGWGAGLVTLPGHRDFRILLTATIPLACSRLSVSGDGSERSAGRATSGVW